MDLNKIYVILDHPEECRNIGAACRAMANNNITHLRIVGKKEDYDEEKIRILAIHAAYIYENAQFFDSIKSASADCTAAAGTTRRRGKKQKESCFFRKNFPNLQILLQLILHAVQILRWFSAMNAPVLQMSSWQNAP